jgi:hypothetical protein
MPTDSNPTTLARAAETLDWQPTTAPQDTKASRITARNATDKDDLVELLAMLALPDTEDDLVALLPLIPSPAPEADPTAPDPIGETVMTVDAHLAVALSMYRNGGYTLEQIREATDMDPAELAAHLAPAAHTDQGPAPIVVDVPVTLRPATVDLSDLDRPVSGLDQAARERALAMYYGDTDHTDAQISEATGLTPEQIRDLINGYEADFDAASQSAAADRPPLPVAAPIAAAPALVAGLPVEELLAWGEQHSARGVQALAARARAALVDLDARHSSDRAVVAAESQVERLRKQLAKAEQQLRDVKAGKTTALPVTAAVVAVSVPDGERWEQPADKEDRRTIREWARTQGLYPADKGDRGVISQEILRAWAQRGTQVTLARAS